MEEQQQQFYTRKELADLLRISVETVDKWRKKGILGGVLIAGSVRFSKEDIDQLIKRGQEEYERRQTI